jgi:hypothetical protein
LRYPDPDPSIKVKNWELRRFTMNSDPLRLTLEPWKLRIEPWNLRIGPWNLRIEPWNLTMEPRGLILELWRVTLVTVACTKVKMTLNSAAYVEGRQIASIPSRNFRRNMRADCASFS